jgi:hypothetical protein
MEHQEGRCTEFTAMMKVFDPCSLSGARGMIAVGTNNFTKVDARHDLAQQLIVGE